jgi:tRNA A-37 threonylcarbamoyl transferase component Bud32
MKMDWDRVTALFSAARILDTSGREAFLHAACESDAALRAEVETLLDADSDDSFLARPPETAIRAALASVPGLLSAGLILKDRYRIERPLGTGGQAFVYHATDLMLSRAVVVKVMRAAGRQNRWLKSRFEREMQALSRIDHPGVIGILDVGDLADGSPFLVIQYINGRSLRELLATGPLGASRTAGILRQLGAALGAAHAAGVAHQDLKPENIMLQHLGDGSETIKLIDFGIAKIERSELEIGVTTVMVAGTVRYMAPEQFQGENSPACDVYALALVTCEMLSGQPDARALPRSVRMKSRRLFDSALALRPENRPGDIRRWCEEVAHALLQGERLRRRVVVYLAAAALFVAASVVGARALLTYYIEPVRIIEKVGAFDPLREGFLAHNRVTGTVAQNPDRNGYDGWRVFGPGVGDYYYKKLTRTQKRLAMNRGWTLSATMRVEDGLIFADLDFAEYGRRFGIVVFRESDVEIVRLHTQIIPRFQGLDFRMPHIPGAYHRYELRYDPSLQSAELWIDGIKRVEDYRGLSQFQDDMGLFFGAGSYKNDRGAGSFQSVRFEINP